MPLTPSMPGPAAAPSEHGLPRAFVRFWGVRGSIPTPGAATVRYGGNTSCVEMRADGQVIILDAGTGLRLLGRALAEEFGGRSIQLTLLLTHTHWDHIQGLPFFLPVLHERNHLRILGYETRHGLDTLLTSQMESPFFPIGMRELSANIQIEEQKELAFSIGAVRVEAAFANHPGTCVGYRLFTSAGSVAFFPDNEVHLSRERWPESDAETLARARSAHQKMVDFLLDTDVLIMDTQYDCAEYAGHLGWGHGCLDDVIRLALEANVRQLFLFHHDPDHDDAKVDAMQAHARSLVADLNGSLRVDAAREGAFAKLEPGCRKD